MPIPSSDANANSLVQEFGYTYDEAFFRYMYEGALRSAARIVSDWLYKLRTRAFSHFPVSWLTLIAMLNHRIVLTYRAFAR